MEKNKELLKHQNQISCKLVNINTNFYMPETGIKKISNLLRILEGMKSTELSKNMIEIL